MKAECGADMVYYTSCLFLVMGKFGYSLLGQGAGGGPKGKQQIASNCETKQDEGRRKSSRRRTGEAKRHNLNSLLPGSVFRTAPSPDLTSFCLISADAVDRLQKNKNKKSIIS